MENEKLYQLFTNIVKRVLELENLNEKDSLLDLGCSSLGAIKLEWALEEEMGISIQLESIFADITVEQLWNRINGKEQEVKNNFSGTSLEKKYIYATSMQKRLFAIYQYNKRDVSYILSSCRIFNYRFDLNKVKKCFYNLIERHQMLRTTFECVKDNIVMNVHEEIKNNIEIIKGNIIEVVKKDIQPFCLEVDYLFRVQIIEESFDKIGIKLTMHHIIADEMSIDILWREFIKLYQDQELEPLTATYIDYALYQDSLLNSNQMKVMKQFWLNEFSDDIPVIDLPTDYIRPKIMNHEGNTCRFTISEELHTKLKSLSVKKKVSMYTLVLSIFYVFLYKYTRQEDIIIGIPVSGRNQKQLSSVVGMFVNTIALRNKPRKDLSFDDFLSEVKSNSIEALKNQDIPFDEILDSLNLTRDISRNPLFDVVFSYLVSQKSQDLSNRYNVEAVFSNNKASKFDLSLSIVETDTIMYCSFEYCTKLFKNETMVQMSEHFVYLIENIIYKTNTTLNEIEMICESEKFNIVHNFNNTKVDFEWNKTIIDIFERQVQKNFYENAVTFNGAKISYGDLKRKADQLASYLQEHNVKKGDLVLVLLNRGIDVIISMLGIMKCGAVYVPMDVTYPIERLNYIINDCNSKVIITEEKIKKPELNGVFERINIDDINFNLAVKKDINVPTEATDLAYVIYTSGTTGKPKGVMIEHRGIVNLVQYCQNIYKVGVGDTVLQFANYIFDASMLEITLGIMTGATLAIADVDSTRVPDLFLKFVSKENITVAVLPPHFLKQVNNFQPRLLITGGSEVDVQLLKNVKADIYINGYGPTETTIWSSSWIYYKNDKIPNRIPIGKPNPNTQIYIMNGLTLCGIGVPGEICIAGVGVAKGYLNKLDLETEKFIKNPYGEDRIYRTGDLGMWDDNGDILFMGRIDNQVKIRGYRIELGEINSFINMYEPVDEATAVVCKNEDGSDAISLFYTSKEDIPSNEIRRYLTKKLPAYMIPEHIVQLNEFPINRSGKIDCEILKNYKFNIENTIDLSVEDFSEVEKKVMKLFFAVTGCSNIGLEESFFHLGGHSLKAIKLVNAINKELEVKLTVSDIFNHPTVKEISELINSNRYENKLCSIVKLPDGETSYETSNAQKRMFILNRLKKYDTSYNLPLLWRLNQKIDIVRFERAIHLTVQRHESLRTYFGLEDGKIVQYIQRDMKLEIEYLEYESEEKMVKSMVRPFKLTKAPLFRVALVKCEGSQYLFLDIHHIIADGASLNILLDDIADFYNGIEKRELTIQYKDYAAWSKLVEDENDDSIKDYWLNMYDKNISPMNLPYDYALERRNSFQCSSYNFVIDEEITERLKNIAINQKATFFDQLMALLYIWLGKITGQEDIIIGIPVLGRNHHDLSEVIGMFVNTLAIRYRYNIGDSYTKILNEVKQLVVSSLDYQQYSFDKLMEKVQTKLGENQSLIDVFFTYQESEVVKKLEKVINCTQVSKKLNRQGKFSLEVSIIHSKKLHIIFEYRTDLFNENTILAMADELTHLAHVISDYSDICIDKI